MTEKEFLDSIEHLRDPRIWEKDGKGNWHVKDSISNHLDDPSVDKARLPLVDDRELLKSSNQPKYSRDDHIPEDTEYIWL